MTPRAREECGAVLACAENVCRAWRWDPKRARCLRSSGQGIVPLQVRRWIP